MIKKKTITVLLALILLFSCKEKEKETHLFDLLGPEETGIEFANKLTPRSDLNMLKYMYFYNGAGVATGDWNNDGLVDVFFTANQVQNRLYINKGNMQFEDVTVKAGIPDDGGWSNGVSVVDINNDGMLDLYICRVGHYASLKSKNQLLVCTGIDDSSGLPHYEDQAAKYGLDFSGFSTQSAFFDYDADGDLDMYLMNHSLRYNSTFRPREQFIQTYDSLSGDRMYQNNKGRFTDVTKASGINSTSIGYGLGIAVSDINHDGYPDVYIANDFHENDYMYINQQNGTFKDESSERMDHTSQFSMGVDIGDVNNDAHPDIVSLDMLPEDPYILKRSLGDDEYNLFKMKLRYGYGHQYTRNQLQLNRGDGTFSEIGFYSGIAATDWSWASLWMDFDHDGKKDLFISNGIPRRLNDIDYVQYVSNDEMQNMIRNEKMDVRDFSFLEKFPQIKLENKFFKNQGEVNFGDVSVHIRNNKPSFSNGSAYADFDNDGDLDIVVNNIDDPAFIYRNNSNDDHYIRVNVKGDVSNVNAIGAKIIVFCDSEKLVAEKFPVRGFQSSMEVPLQVGLGKRKPDSIWLVWPDLRFQRLDTSKRRFTVEYKKELPKVNYRFLSANPFPFSDIAEKRGLLYTHEENEYVEFNREPLMPFMVSMDGPALAVGDMNNDGLDDVFVGSARGKTSALFLQQATGRFVSVDEDLFRSDSLFEDVDALWSDINRDGYQDLIIAGSGNEYYGADTLMHPRIYLNEGGKRLVRKGRISGVNFTESSLRKADVNGDGLDDLFIGCRTQTFGYGIVPESYLFMNDGAGNFKDVTEEWIPELRHLGMVKDAVWTDLDGDKDRDLVVVLEWGGVVGFIRAGKSFQKIPISVRKGWWNTVKAADIDNDGDEDLVLGNQGENSRIRPTVEEPVRMYYDDVDGNGLKEQLITYYAKGNEIPFSGKGELDKQVPALKKTFLYAAEYARADVQEIFGNDNLIKAMQHTAETFSHMFLINKGKMNFNETKMPYFTQWTCYRDFLIMDVNGDGLKDLLPAGNFYGEAIAMGRSDAEHGSVWLNKGEGNWALRLLPKGMMKGEVRKLQKMKLAGGEDGIVFARNGGKIGLLVTKQKTR